eukprot:5276205-Pyramimonas_sp.AAC.2
MADGSELRRYATARARRTQVNVEALQDRTQARSCSVLRQIPCSREAALAVLSNDRNATCERSPNGALHIHIKPSTQFRWAVKPVWCTKQTGVR